MGAVAVVAAGAALPQPATQPRGWGGERVLATADEVIE